MDTHLSVRIRFWLFLDMTYVTVTPLHFRERPHLVFPPGQSRPGHLVTAVCSAPACSGPCVDCKYQAHDYTLVTPLVTQEP